MIGAERDWSMLLRLDWLMISCMCILITIGVMFIYSACFLDAELPVRSLYKKQIIWALVGLAVYVCLTLFDYRQFQELSWAFYGVTLVLLVLVLIIGQEINGAKRSFEFFNINIQPSEIAKIATIICLAHFLSLHIAGQQDFRVVAVALAIVAAPMLLTLIEPDLGTALMFIPLVLITTYISGVPGRYLRRIILVGVLVVAQVVAAAVVPEKLGWSKPAQERALSVVLLKSYHLDRFRNWLDPQHDPQDGGYAYIQTRMAVGSGGLTGKGYLQGMAKSLRYLPNTVAPTDFIHAVIAEEKGFVGSSSILILFMLMILCGLRTAMRAKDRMGQLICVGVVVMLFCHVFVNVAMTVGLLPITGLPLPLISYGGSFMISTMVALGLVQSVHVRNAPERNTTGI